MDEKDNEYLSLQEISGSELIAMAIKVANELVRRKEEERNDTK